VRFRPCFRSPQTNIHVLTYLGYCTHSLRRSQKFHCYTLCEFDCSRPLMEDTWHEGSCVFLPVWRTPLLGPFWKFVFVTCTFYTNVTGMVAMGLKFVALCMETNLSLTAVNSGFFGKCIHICMTLYIFGTNQAYFTWRTFYVLACVSACIAGIFLRLHAFRVYGTKVVLSCCFPPNVAPGLLKAWLWSVYN
jgi:hypothetical protein